MTVLIVFLLSIFDSPHRNGHFAERTFQSLVFTEGLLCVGHAARYPDFGESQSYLTTV